MRPCTVVGTVADQIGAASYVYCLWPRTLRRYIAAPSTRYRVTQGRVPVMIDHRASVGTVEHLELDADRHLIAVAVVDGDTFDRSRDWFWSPTVRDGVDETGALDLLELSMTENPASLCLPPLTVLDGDLRSRYSGDRVIERAPNLRSRDLLLRAQVEHRVRDGRMILHVENRSDLPGYVRSADDMSYYPAPTVPRVEIAGARGAILSVQ